MTDDESVSIMLQCLPSHESISLSRYETLLAVLFPILLASASPGCSCVGKERLSGDGSEGDIEAEEESEPLPEILDIDAADEVTGDLSEPDPADIPAEELEPPVYWSRLYSTDSMNSWAASSPAGDDRRVWDVGKWSRL